MFKMDKKFWISALHCYLLIQGTCLALISIMHIALCAASLLINSINIYIRRSALPVILVILSLPMIVISLINAVYFSSELPLVLFCTSVPVSAGLALAIQFCRRHLPGKE